MKYMIKLTSLTALLLAFLSGSLLFWISQQVQQVEREQKKLISANVQQEEAIRVLKAEWDYLNRPERLELLASKYLNMTPVSAETLVQSISAIPEPEDPSLAPAEQIIPASTKTAKTETAPVQKLVQLPPPVLSHEEPAKEDAFNNVLQSVETGR